MSFYTLNARFEINTPMLIGGANQNQAELSVKAIKSAIMFWWRVANHGVCKGNLAELHRQERELFGSTSAISSIRMSLQCDKKLDSNTLCKQINADYLLGQDMGARKALIANQPFSLRLLSKREIDTSVINAVKLFGLLGGLGAKALKGFGSIQLIELTSTAYGNQPQALDLGEDYVSQLSNFINISPPRTSPAKTSQIPCLEHCRLDITEPEQSAEDVLQKYSAALHQYRTNAKPSYNNFKEDCDWFMRRENVDDNYHPERAVFGLPHNYFVNIPGGANLKAEVKPHSFTRRQSPLQFHVHKLEDNHWVGVLLYFKSVFLPSTQNKIDMVHSITNGSKRLKVSTVDMIGAEHQHSIISDFMSGKPRPQGDKNQPRLLNTQTLFEDGQRLVK
jgi:CRISPR-associated protein Cmr1